MVAEAERYYPEINAGGFSRVDGTVAFYVRVQALLSDIEGPAVVVDLGAGRGVSSSDTVRFRRKLQNLQADGRRVIGIDVDSVVHSNPLIDEARVFEVGSPLPLDDASVDLVVSRFAFEHIVNPEHVAAELARVVKPGGWVCATTPNKWGYIALGARLVPNRFHVGALRRLQPSKAGEDTFPTRYGMNTPSDLKRLFPTPTFDLYTFTHDSEPQLYAGGSRVVTKAIHTLRLLPPSVRSLRQIFIRRN